MGISRDVATSLQWQEAKPAYQINIAVHWSVLRAKSAFARLDFQCNTLDETSFSTMSTYKYQRHEYIAHASLVCTSVCMYGAASPRRRPPPPKPRLSFQQTVICHPRSCPPKLGLANGGSGSTWNHKTGNHRGGVGKDNPQHREPQGPFPFPSSSTHRR